MKKWLALPVALSFTFPGGCSSSGVNRLFGEVHVHGFPGGVHPAALFVAQPLPAARADGESIFGPDGPALGSCAAGPAAGMAPPVIEAVDAGRVQILGGSGIGRVELAFDTTVRAYLPTVPAPLPMTELFSGGEELRISAAGATAPAFASSLRAPRPLSLTAPSALDRLDGDLEVRWPPSSATRVSLILVGSTTDGRWASIACNSVDADGNALIPAALLAGLPSPPRDLQLQVSRDEIVRAPSARDGDGVVLHVGYEVTLDGHEDPH